MKSKKREKERAVSLRRKGYSFREISDILKISKSTASLWLRDIKLTEEAASRIQDLKNKGRLRANKTNEQKRVLREEEVMKKAENFLFTQDISSEYLKLACTLLYWCEGTKYKENKSVTFTNSDPEMISYFLYTFRNSFDLDEKKFRGLVHLHEYHDEKKQLDFWSKSYKNSQVSIP